MSSHIWNFHLRANVERRGTGVYNNAFEYNHWLLSWIQEKNDRGVWLSSNWKDTTRKKPSQRICGNRQRRWKRGVAWRGQMGGAIIEIEDVLDKHTKETSVFVATEIILGGRQIERKEGMLKWTRQKRISFLTWVWVEKFPRWSSAVNWFNQNSTNICVAEERRVKHRYSAILISGGAWEESPNSHSGKFLLGSRFGRMNQQSCTYSYHSCVKRYHWFSATQEGCG